MPLSACLMDAKGPGHELSKTERISSLSVWGGGAPHPCGPKHGRGTHPSGQERVPQTWAPRALPTLSGCPSGRQPYFDTKGYSGNMGPAPLPRWAQMEGLLQPCFPKGIFQAGWERHFQENTNLAFTGDLLTLQTLLGSLHPSRSPGEKGGRKTLTAPMRPREPGHPPDSVAPEPILE